MQNVDVYLKAMKITLEFSFFGILLSLVIGVIGSFILYYRIKILKEIVKGYVEVSRNTPLLIQVFFLYFGLPKIGIDISSTTCGIIGLAFLGGSYMIESFRSGLEAVSLSQIESGKSLGLSKVQRALYIIFPQGLSIAIPSLGANCIFLIKETSILGAIAIGEVVFLTKDIIGMYYKTSEALFMLVIAYLIILLPINIILRIIERKSRFAQYGS